AQGSQGRASVPCGKNLDNGISRLRKRNGAAFAPSVQLDFLILISAVSAPVSHLRVRTRITPGESRRQSEARGQQGRCQWRLTESIAPPGQKSLCPRFAACSYASAASKPWARSMPAPFLT